VHGGARVQSFEQSSIPRAQLKNVLIRLQLYKLYRIGGTRDHGTGPSCVARRAVHGPFCVWVIPVLHAVESYMHI
jgi:hypothetical protein